MVSIDIPSEVENEVSSKKRRDRGSVRCKRRLKHSFSLPTVVYSH